MKLLRRALYLDAVAWAVSGAAFLFLPGTALRALGQAPIRDVAYVRVTGLVALALSMVMVLVAQKLDDVWWWSWTFAVTDAALATVAGLHAAVGVPPGSGSLLWWVVAAVSLALGAALLAGLGRTGQEKPFV